MVADRLQRHACSHALESSNAKLRGYCVSRSARASHTSPLIEATRGMPTTGRSSVGCWGRNEQLRRNAVYDNSPGKYKPKMQRRADRRSRRSSLCAVAPAPGVAVVARSRLGGTAAGNRLCSRSYRSCQLPRTETSLKALARMPASASRLLVTENRLRLRHLPA